jgi:UDP-N-acetylglucosamine:LPS N-acetylglucosamine transferase
MRHGREIRDRQQGECRRIRRAENGGSSAACEEPPADGFRSQLDLQLIYIRGKSEKIANALRGKRSRLPRFVEGFTTRVNYYMQLADFFIGKPGPGSVSEALAMRLPVIVECNAWTLPQERYNADWILENEVGLVLRSFRHVDRTVAQLIEPVTLARYCANAAALHNRAAFETPEILDKIFDLTRGAPASARSLQVDRLA